MNDNLPPLPKPEALQRKQLNHGGYEMRPVFTADQMREYGQLCRQQALEEAAKLAEQTNAKENYSHVEALIYDAATWDAAEAIRSLK